MHSITQKVNFIESVFGKGILSGNGLNLYVRCPLCSPTNVLKKKLAIRVTDDAHHCWTCGWKSYSLSPLIKKFGTSSQLAEYRNFFKTNEKKEILDTEKNEKVLLPSDFQLLVECSQNNPDAKAAWNYLKNRNITPKDAWYFKLGISNVPQWRRRIIFPSFDSEGDLNIFVARNIDQFDKRSKYDNPKIDKSAIVFNEINIDWNEPLVICEGFFDLMKCPENSTALLSSDFNFNSKLFSMIALNNTSVILALDSDMKTTKTSKIFKKMQFFDLNVKIADFSPYNDPAELSKKECREKIKNSKTMSWEENFFSKLEGISNMSLTI